MKHLTTLVAVAALIAGMSMASAQAPSSGMQSPGAGAAKTAAKPAVKGTDPFCVVNPNGGQTNCHYASIEACKKDPKLRGRQCVANPGKSTSGAK